MTRSKRVASLFIILAIGLHAVPVVFYQGQRQTRWPFLAWAMYAKSLPPGPIETKQRRLIGVTPDGDEESVTSPLVGLSKSTFGRYYVQPLGRGDSARARELLQRLNGRREEPFVALRLEGETYTVSDSGIVKETHPTVTFLADSPAGR
jgi:hypothetical protein